ncbi:hypothetical protein V8B97DRAFT_1935074 [Scleroderma yunnanense]
MAPRTTRNSNGLRSPVVPRRAARPRAPVRSAKAPPAATAASMSTEAGDEDDEYYSKKIKWLKCRDQYGVPVIVKYSDTGEGVHMIWNWSEFEDEEASNAMDEDEDVMEDDVATPPPTAFEKVLNTPQQQHPYDAGSVLRTPVKKAKPLRPSLTRLGDRGIYGGCERPGFYREVNGDYRMILNHDVGSLVNLSREQVEEQQIVDDHKIFVVQLQKLMAETEALTREDMGIIPAGGCGDVAMDEVPAKRRVQTAGPAGTILLSGEPIHQPNHRVQGDKMAGPDATTGPNGEKLDRQGRRMLGPEGTILVDPTFGPKRRTRLPAPREIPEEEEVEVPVRKTPRRGPPRRVQLIARPLGPEATEICHY